MNPAAPPFAAPPRAAERARPFPWRALMRIFLGERAMAPADFWTLTVPEIQAVLGPAESAVTRRADLARLMECFPDGR